MNLFLPSNAYQFFSLLFDISNYNIFPVGDLYAYLFPSDNQSYQEDDEGVYLEDLMEVPKQKVVNLNFQSFGYSTSFLDNSKNIPISLVSFILSILIVELFGRACIKITLYDTFFLIRLCP